MKKVIALFFIVGLIFGCNVTCYDDRGIYNRHCKYYVDIFDRYALICIINKMAKKYEEWGKEGYNRRVGHFN
jgi:hypothetical protein